MSRRNDSRSIHRGDRSTDAAFLFMLCTFVVPLVAGSIYVLVLDLEGQMKAAIAISALVVAVPLIVLMAFVAMHPIEERRTHDPG